MVHSEYKDYPKLKVEHLQPAAAAFIGVTAEASLKRIDVHRQRIPYESVLNQAIRIKSWREYTSIFGYFVEDAHLPDAIFGYFANGGEICYVISIRALYEDTREAALPASAMVPAGSDGKQSFVVTAAIPGAGGNSLQVAISEEVDKRGRAAAAFTLDAGGERQTHLTLDPEAGPPYRFIGDVSFAAVEISEIGPAGTFPDPGVYRLEGGGIRPLSAEQFTQGIAALEGLDEANLLLCPDLMVGYDGSSDSQEQAKAVQSAMAAYCEEKPGRLAILDTPPWLSAQEAKEYRDFLGLESQAAALFYPWIVAPDLSGSPMVQKALPPGGHIAGIFQRVHRQYGRLLSPANELLAGSFVPSPHFEITPVNAISDGEYHVLLGFQVNCIRSFPWRGVRLWGARTLQNDFLVVGEAGGSPEAETAFSEARIRPIETLEDSIAAFIGITARASDKGQSFLNEPVLLQSWEEYVSIFGNLTPEAYLPWAVHGFFHNGGERCYVVSLRSLAGFPEELLPALTLKDYLGNYDERSGLVALEALDDVGIIACPDLLHDYDGSDSAKEMVKHVQSAIIAHCEQMRYPVAVLDTPPDLTPQQAREWRYYVNFDSSYAALYYPWIDVLDEQNRSRRIPPSGHIAGMFERARRRHGLQKPPANLRLRGAVNLAYDLSDREQGVLYPVGVNCLRAFPGRGIRAWSARTMSSDSRWRHIHVRRLMSMVMRSLVEGTLWIQFELYEPALLPKVRATITTFLEELRLKGILAGSSPEEAYFVQCDEEFNPRDQREAGLLHVNVGVAIANPATFFGIYLIHSDSLARMFAEVDI